MNLTRILVAFALFGPLVLGLGLAVAAAVLVRRSFRSLAPTSCGNPSRPPWPTVLVASFLWVAVVSLASWVGVLVAFGSAWAEAHAPRTAPPTFPTQLVAYLAVNAMVMAGIALLLTRFVRARYIHPKRRPSSHVSAPRA